jgi:iron complex transport system permease protein
MRPERRADLLLTLVPLALLAAMAAGILFGPEALSPAILDRRILRVLLAAAVGAALAVAGVIFQAILRNPLADPYVLGASSGAGLGATIFLAAVPAAAGGLLGAWGVPAAAFAGAALSVGLVYRLAQVGGRIPRMTLLLTGVVVGYVLGGLALFVVSVAGYERLHDVMWWLLGSFSVGNPTLIAAVWWIAAAGAGAAWLLSRDLDLLALGEEQAQHLGLSPERAKRLFFLLGSLLTGAAVCASGLIGFVGLVVPHMVRLAIGPAHRRLVPVSAFAGATFLVLVELASRSVYPGREINVGVVTALVGGPFFLWLLRRQRKVFWG